MKCSCYIKAIYPAFLWFIDAINYLGCWKNTRKACKSLSFGLWLTISYRFLSASHVGYRADKPLKYVIWKYRDHCIYLIFLSTRPYLLKTFSWQKQISWFPFAHTHSYDRLFDCSDHSTECNWAALLCFEFANAILENILWADNSVAKKDYLFN